MTSSAVAAKGITLTMNTFAIAEIDNIGDIGLSAETIDVTNHDSANSVKEFIGGLLDGGDVSVEGNFIAGNTTGQVAMWAALKLRTVQAFIMTFPTAITATWTFSAVVTDFKTKHPIKDKLGFSAKLKISGLPVLAISQSVDATTIAISVGTLIPAWAVDKYDYCDAVVAGTATVTITVTDATAATRTVHNSFDNSTASPASGVATGALTLGAVDTITTFTITCTDTGKVPKIYTIRVLKAAA
jgi:predicted secreted protein